MSDVTDALQALRNFVADGGSAADPGWPALEALVNAALQSAATKPAQVGEWRGIESAPRDGTEFLGLISKPRPMYVVAVWLDNEPVLACDHSPLPKLNGWRPLSIATDGVALIELERLRQIQQEGWSSAHDDEHTDGSLARAASCYALPHPRKMRDVADTRGELLGSVPRDWPWAFSWWKPCHENRIRELAKAGALIAAEIDRLQRAQEGTAR